MVNTGQLKSPSSFAQFQFLQKPHVCQQSQGSVDRGQRDLHVQLYQLLMHVLRAEVVATAEPFEQPQNPLPLRRQASTVLMQSLLQCSALSD